MTKVEYLLLKAAIHQVASRKKSIWIIMFAISLLLPHLHPSRDSWITVGAVFLFGMVFGWIHNGAMKESLDNLEKDFESNHDININLYKKFVQ